MTIFDFLKIGNLVTFDTVAPAILGNDYQNLKVVGIFDRDTAKMWRDVDSMHANVYPFMDSSIENDSTAYQYVKLVGENGHEVVLGVPWINESTIRVVARGKLTIVINDLSVEDRERVLTAIEAVNIRVDKYIYD